MPVLNPFVDGNHVAGVYLLRWLTFFLVPAFTGSTHDDLETVVVDVPVVPATRFKVDVGNVDINVVVRANQTIQVAGADKSLGKGHVLITKAEHVVLDC